MRYSAFIYSIILILTIFIVTACDNWHNTEEGYMTPPCSTSQSPAGATINCPDGSSSFISNGVVGPAGATGAIGVTGPVGDRGPAGLDGTNGSNGTEITIVQFCPGTPSYPSTFPEIGFVINGGIYAVYSANDGFMTYLPPGLYQSNAIGSSCTFTINADGSVSH